MNGQRPGDRETGRDPVEEFFAAHRAQIQEEPVDDLTWQRIRDGRRRERTNRGAWVGGLVAAAAALAVVFGPNLIPDADLPDPAAPATTEPATTAMDPTTTSPDAPGQSVTTPVPEGELSKDGRFTDTTTADPGPATDTGVRYGLVLRPCATNGWCSVLAASQDGGITWAPRADLEELGVAHRVLFIDHRRGWVWGDKAPLWTTTDGGQTWTSVRLGADAVQDVSVRNDVLLATTLSYDTGACTSAADCPLVSSAVVLTDPTDADWTDNVATDLGPVGEATVLDTGDARYVTTTSDIGSVALWRLQDDALEATAAVSGCGTGPVAVTASVDDPDHLWALCDDERGLVLHESDNGARTWTPSNLTVPSFVLGEQPPLMASVGADHLLLVGEGNFAVTANGGQTWSPEEFLPGASVRPEQIEVTQFGEVIVYPTAEQADPGLGYWRSGDWGVTWDVVTPRG